VPDLRKVFLFPFIQPPPVLALSITFPLSGGIYIVAVLPMATLSVPVIRMVKVSGL